MAPAPIVGIRPFAPMVPAVGATPRASSTLAASAGSFTLSGVAASLVASRRLAAGAGSFSEVGVSAGLRVTRVLTGTPGAFTLSGVAANLVKSTAGAFTLAAAPGSFALSGVAAGLKAARRLTASPGPFSLAGRAATLAFSGVAPARVPLEVGLGAYLAADPAIAALAGARVYRNRIPQGVKATGPSLAYRVVSRTFDQVLSGDTGYVRARVQVVATGAHADAEGLAFAARSACNRIPQGDMGGVDVAAAWVDPGEGGDEDDVPAGTDSTRSSYRFDVRIDYSEPLT